MQLHYRHVAAATADALVHAARLLLLYCCTLWFEGPLVPGTNTILSPWIRTVSYTIHTAPYHIMPTSKQQQQSLDGAGAVLLLCTGKSNLAVKHTSVAVIVAPSYPHFLPHPQGVRSDSAQDSPMRRTACTPHGLHHHHYQAKYRSSPQPSMSRDHAAPLPVLLLFSTD